MTMRLHLGRAFADPADTRLAVPPLEGELLETPLAAVDLDGLVDHNARAPRSSTAWRWSLDSRVLPAVVFPRALPISHRVARSSTSASASIHWIAWPDRAARTNVSRCLAWRRPSDERLPPPEIACGIGKRSP